MSRTQVLDTGTGELSDYHSLTLAYGLWMFLGLLGGHWFYLGRKDLGILYLLTAGCFGVGWLLDFANMPDHVRHSNHWS